MNREEIFELIEDTQIANLVVEWHESNCEERQNEIFNFLYHQEGVKLEELFSIGLKFNF